MFKNIILKFLSLDQDILNTKNKKLIERWYSIRYFLFYNCVSKEFYTSVSKSPLKNILDTFKKILFNFFHILKIPFLIKKRDVLVIDVGRYKYYNNKINDPISAMFEEAGIDFNLVSVASNSFVLKRQINISILVKLINIFLNKKRSNDHLGNFNSIDEKLKSYFPGIDINKKFLKNNIENYQAAVCIILKFLIYLLKPKRVVYLETPYLHKIIKYCNLNNIETIDVQHSLVSDLNILYKFKLTGEYKYLISKKILTWGQHWKQFYSYNERCFEIGNFDYFLPRKINKQKILTIISSIYSREKFLDLAAKLLKDFDQYKIVYKLRPGEEMPNYKVVEQLKNNKNFFFSNLDPGEELEELLNKSEYVIGTNSTLLIESIGKTEVIVYETGWHEEYSDLIKKKIFFSAKDYLEMKYIIQNKFKNDTSNTLDFFATYKSDNLRSIFNS